jgi:hypothetical protein
LIAGSHLGQHSGFETVHLRLHGRPFSTVCIVTENSVHGNVFLENPGPQAKKRAGRAVSSFCGLKSGHWREHLVFT